MMGFSTAWVWVWVLVLRMLQTNVERFSLFHENNQFQFSNSLVLTTCTSSQSHWYWQLVQVLKVSGVDNLYQFSNSLVLTTCTSSQSHWCWQLVVVYDFCFTPPAQNIYLFIYLVSILFFKKILVFLICFIIKIIKKTFLLLFD